HQLLAAPVDVDEDGLDAAGEVRVTHDDGDRDDEPGGRGDQRLTDAVRDDRWIAGPESRDLTERDDHARDGAEKPEHGSDLRDGGERPQTPGEHLLLLDR